LAIPIEDESIPVGEMKLAAARNALELVQPGVLLGVGSGSTVWAFLDLLGKSGIHVPAAVAASAESAHRLAALGIEVLDLGDLRPPVYIDGADEIDFFGRAIKGGGAAHTREKAIATASEYWACIVDASKVVIELGHAPVPLEVTRQALPTVFATLAELDASAVEREGVLTDAGNPVLDVRGLDLSDPLALEDMLDGIPGVLGNGIFARRTADLIVVGNRTGGVERILPHGEGENLAS